MNRRYINALLREAQANPAILPAQQRFWKPSIWERYLERCDDLLFDDPDAAFRLVSVAPSYAEQLNTHASSHNAADAMMQAHSYLASAHRALARYADSETAFLTAARFRTSASPAVLADHLRRFAYLRICQRDPHCFQLIEEALSIHKQGNLVHRHPLGECLLCRGHANIVFGYAGRSFDDLTAALNHLSLRVDEKSWYAALNNLLFWAVEHGDADQLAIAHENLKPALMLLNTHRSRRMAKLRLRWLIALFDSRIGNHARAAIAFKDLRAAFANLGRVYEYAGVSVDLVDNYLNQGLDREASEIAVSTSSFLELEGASEDDLVPWRTATLSLADLRAARSRYLHSVDAFARSAA